MNQSQQAINTGNSQTITKQVHPQVSNITQQQILIQPEEQPQDQKFIQQNIQLYNKYKKQANQKYSNKLYAQAIPLYRKALRYLNITDQKDNTNTNHNDINNKDVNNEGLSDDNQNDTQNTKSNDIIEQTIKIQQNKKLKSIIYSNIGLTFIKMQQDDIALDYLLKALKLNPSYTKARLNLAQCYENLQKPQQALQQYKKSYKIYESQQQHDPSTKNNLKFTRQKIQRLEIKVKQVQQKRKQQVLDGLKSIGNSVLGFFGMSLDNFKLQQQPGGGYNVSFKQ